MHRKTLLLTLLIFLIFATLTSCELPKKQPLEKTLYIGANMVKCMGKDEFQKCLLVKERPEDQYTYYYDQIEGFHFEEGNEYQLVVREEAVEHSSTESTTIKWVLVEVVNKTPVDQALSLPNFEGKLWKLEAFRNASSELTDVLPEVEITALFLDGHVNGLAGCNTYFGSYNTNLDQLAFTEVVSTGMTCDDMAGVMDQENEFLSALAESTTFKLTDSKMEIIGFDGEPVLIFSRSAPSPLQGTLWLLDYYAGSDGEIFSLIPGTEISIVFNDDNTLYGSSGCNNYSSTYSIEDDNISINEIITTRMYCSDPDGTMDQELGFQTALNSATSYHIEENTLLLFDIEGTAILNYSARSEIKEPAGEIPDIPKDLVGSIWKWISYTDANQDPFITDDPLNYTLEFLSDGSVSIQAECNNAAGVYKTNDSNISIQVEMTTLAVCTEGSISDGYLRLLEDAVTYATEDEYLYLNISNETGEMVFSNATQLTLSASPTTEATLTPEVKATQEPTTTPLLTLTVEPTYTQIPNNVFEDDFTYYSGWTIEQGDNHGFSWEEGYYTISINTRNGYVWSVRSILLEDSILEADASRLDGESSSYYGVVCRFQTGNDYYALVISDSGSYGIAKMEFGLLNFLIEGKDQSGIIKPNGQMNKVRGDCIGDTLTLYVNDHKLTEVQDTSFQSGNVGLIAITFQEKILDVLFDRFAAYQK